MSQGKVLLIDDSELVKDLVTEALEPAGFEVSWLESPMLLAVTMRKEQPDVVLMDVNMPAISGDKAMQLAHQFGTTRAVPVLYHSSRSGDELRELVTKTGADGYLEKGCSSMELLRQVTNWVKVGRARKAKLEKVGS
jgi:CheY-like chemotaxis protein